MEALLEAKTRVPEAKASSPGSPKPSKREQVIKPTE